MATKRKLSNNPKTPRKKAASKRSTARRAQARDPVAHLRSICLALPEAGERI